MALNLAAAAGGLGVNVPTDGNSRCPGREMSGLITDHSTTDKLDAAPHLHCNPQQGMVKTTAHQNGDKTTRK